ncbi:MAG: leucine-rich repeat protein [Ruminococcus sp.]|nr:leucine-rich repeat protein [Ruminococcus sp.]
MKKLTAAILASALSACAAVPYAASAATLGVDVGTIVYDTTSSSRYSSIINDDIEAVAVISSIESTGNYVYIPDTTIYDGKNTAFVSLGMKALALNTEINSIRLPSYLVNIDDYAFQGCLNLDGVELPSSLKSLGIGSFMSCTSLTSIDLSGTDKALTEIPARCFYSCTSLGKVTIGDNITTIGGEAFFGCPVLDITIPPTVTNIGKNAIGVHADPHTSQIVNYQKVVIRGETGSYAESYALANGIDFLDENNCIMGDIDGNGLLSSVDASAVLRAYSNMATGNDSGMSIKQEYLADINGDNQITASDASAILSEYAKSATK